jgi:hypothetical protein
MTAHKQSQQPPPPSPHEVNIYICRNKHFPYIASYHGPWLSLPVELFQSLLSINNETGQSSHVYPVDRTIFTNLLKIRKLVDEAAELVIKAAGSGSSGPSMGMPYGGNDGRGGNKVSPVRQHRLRELAVSKLAEAYRIDEIGTSVLTMQSASALDDVAAKVSITLGWFPFWYLCDDGVLGLMSVWPFWFDNKLTPQRR